MPHKPLDFKRMLGNMRLAFWGFQIRPGVGLPLKEVSLERLDLYYTDMPSQRRAQTQKTGSPTKFSEKWMLPVRPKSSIESSTVVDTRGRMLALAIF